MAFTIQLVERLLRKAAAVQLENDLIYYVLIADGQRLYLFTVLFIAFRIVSPPVIVRLLWNQYLGYFPRLHRNLVGGIEMPGQVPNEINVQSLDVIVDQTLRNRRPITGGQIVIVERAFAVTKQFGLGPIHVRPKERQLLKAADGRLIGFLMKLAVFLIHFCNAVVRLDLHRRKFL